MLAPSRLASALVIALALTGCYDGNEAPALRSFSPSTVVSGQSVEAEILGTHLSLSPSIALDRTSKITSKPELRVFLNEVLVPDAILVDDNTIQLTIPRSLPAIDDYRLKVYLGETQHMELPAVLDVVNATVSPDTGEPVDAGPHVLETPFSTGGLTNPNGLPDSSIAADAGAAKNTEAPNCDGPELSLIPSTCSDGLDNNCDDLKDAEQLSCSPLDEPVLIAAIVGAGINDEPSFTDDLLELYFQSTRSGILQIYVSTRSDAEQPWAAAQLVNIPNLQGTPRLPRISPDGLSLYLSLASDSAATLYVSQRLLRTSDWQTPVALPRLNGNAEESEPSISTDGLEMVLSVVQNANGDLALSTRDSLASPWSPMTLLGGVNSAGAMERSGQLHANGKLLFFKSNRPGVGLEDLYVASRQRRGQPFSNPILLSVNTVSDEESIWVSPDLSYAVISSNRSGSIQLYEVALNGLSLN